LPETGDTRVPENELEGFTGKHMVETPEQGIIGVENGAFTDDEYICTKDNTHRICAPTSGTRMTACIFWTRASPEDTSPTWDKVVSLFLIFCVSRKLNNISLGQLSTILTCSIKNSVKIIGKLRRIWLPLTTR
jgi:hypothetical protein